ncbi:MULTISPECIES: DUF1127 domain-containing protein [Bradyrhizobium]|jgi:uncharacterized protein YjiS (DUF1127 family)|uniref:Uncharacterized protein YjiS (DUF1127 family) n=1 Tax=Bradyrhizobium ottawaense TaxID=931866 RepID=A0ABV4FSC2_9BRAD|nr:MULTISPECIES: DUF1127 domain-containing protein [Bradyrhizobium]GMO12045.1 DUF1127 domain-containing protein [Bradyrhizobium sp. TM233]MBR0983725.1 DUF1127 domain-containing protein [Bradyrhizobium liaoningense]MBR1293241.1 DUF1127 domain-containing protein [Bradyrhizobium ottawaense]MBR1361509.1 DUF1127 domain-containing protein [Bradyrhizobium ottawaense]MDA9416325.1 hypothetical protein [Bradyrhizobium sp. CCBAU 25360]
MSTLTHNSMTNHHAPGLIQQIGETLHVWHERYRNRRELTQWTARDLQDVGLSWTDIAYEADKPFWRA